LEGDRIYIVGNHKRNINSTTDLAHQTSQQSFDYQMPTRIVFGCHAVSRLGQLVAENEGSRVLLVSDPGVVSAGHTARAVNALEDAGIETFTFSDIQENPTTAHVIQATGFARENRIDSIVGIGGGSAMDTAKGVNFLYTNGGSMEDYWGIGKAKKNMLPMIAVPTTAGTGSESQSFALITKEDTHQKMACGDKKAMCKVAILDPVLTLTQPPKVASATGFDAISHAVESWVCKTRNPVSTMFAGEAWSYLAQAYDKVATAPEDLDARAAMQIGASLSGAAIEHSMLGAAHACANPLTAKYKTVHGLAVGLMLPHVVRFNAVEFDDLYGQLLLRGGLTDSLEDRAGDRLADWLTARLQCHGLPERLADIGVDRNDLPLLVQEASTQWTAQFNPRKLSEKDFQELYEAAY
jgi:alcohol dehydrogenase